MDILRTRKVLFVEEVIYLNLITGEDKIVIPSIIKSCILHWFHTYLRHPVLYRMEVMIWEHCTGQVFRKSVQKEVTKCDTCQRTKRSNKKYVILPSKEAKLISCNRLCIYLIVTYVMRRKGHKEILCLKSVIMIDSVTGWFEIMQYNDKKAISITKLFGTTWLTIYPIPIEITYDQGSEFNVH